MRTIKHEVYKFNELSEGAQAVARDWWRGSDLDYEWWDDVYADCIEVAERLGIEIGYRSEKNAQGETVRGNPKIYFSGFSSQGDGACFEGTYSYRSGWRKALIDYAPSDKRLLSIGEALQEVQSRAFYGITAKVTHTGQYYHSYSITIDVECDRDIKVYDERIVRDALRDFAEWIYSSLRMEYEYRMSDEYITEALISNGYEFYEDGRRARD